jgi:PadR family transcriptional regulator PadR
VEVPIKKGLLEICILAILSHNENYGYMILTDILQVLDTTEPSLYTNLKKLEADNMLTTRNQEHNGRLRKYYRITDKGKHKMKTHLSDLQELQRVVEFVLDRVGGQRDAEYGENL